MKISWWRGREKGENTLFKIVILLLSCVWLCNPMDYSMPHYPVLHYLPEFAQIHIHWVSDVTPSTWGAHLLVSSFCLFIQFMEFSRQEYCSGLPFPPPVDHVLSEPFTMTHPSWVALHGMAHSFIELHKPLHHNKAVIHEGVF